MREEEQHGLRQSAAQRIVATTGQHEEARAHERSSATTRGGEYSGSAARGHWNNNRTAYNYYYCDGDNQHHTYYRGDGGYGTYNSDGYYTGVELDYYGYDSCGYNDNEANYVHNMYYHGNDGHGTYNSEGDYACANINTYNDGSCGYTSYEEEYRCYSNTYEGNHGKDEYGGYYNEYVGAKTDGYETNYPPTDDDSGPTSREGGRGHREEDEMCGIAEHT